MTTTQKAADRIADLFALQGDQLRATLAAHLAETNNANRLRGARTLRVPTTPGITQTIYASPGRLMGWTLRNSAGVGQLVVNLYDSRNADPETLIGTVSIGSGSAWGQSSVWMGPSGVSITDALTVEVVTASGAPALAGSVYVGAVD